LEGLGSDLGCYLSGVLVLFYVVSAGKWHDSKKNLPLQFYCSSPHRRHCYFDVLTALSIRMMSWDCSFL
jgi:hypothetical protein